MDSRDEEILGIRSHFELKLEGCWFEPPFSNPEFDQVSNQAIGNVLRETCDLPCFVIAEIGDELLQ